MNYKVLYRKYRPESFEDLIGQDHVKTILKNSIINGKISHAYIFSGPRGTGKTSTAKIFAKTVNCLDNQQGEACGKCVNCVNFSNSTDIIEIDAASNNGVDQIREITNNIKLMPAMSKYKVYIIDEVHMLSQSAFNALLLTLEEPPSHVIFILATTNIESVPITILSRCQRFDFKKVGVEKIILRLKHICDKEKIKIEDEALSEIAYLSDGGVRDALSILDQMSKSGKKITLEMIASEVGSISSKSIEKLIESVENNDIDEIVSIINEYQKSNPDYKVVIKKIIDITSKKAISTIKGINAGRLKYDDYKQLVFDLTDLLNRININVDAFLLLELTLLKYIDKKEKQEIISEEKPVKKTSDKADYSFDAYARVNNCFVDAKKTIKKQSIEEWNKFTDSVNSKKIKQLVADTSVVLASNDIYVLCADSLVVGDLNSNSNLITKEFKKAFNKKVLFVALDEKDWERLSKKYIDDYKSGIKYEYINENINKDKEEIEKMATSLFDGDKIEID